MIIALDINAEYMISFEYILDFNGLWCISIGFHFVGGLAIMNQLYHSFKIPRLFLQLQISMFKCKWGICAKVDR